jgi:glycosyltransferase involved in cell wall biosynthesis
MTRKLPVVIAGTNCLSGVTTWADQLRDALADHPRYQVRLLYIGPDQPPDFDICAATAAAAQQSVRRLAPVILFPNYLWELYLTGFEPGVYCVGMCHADSDEQYYSPLSWYEPFIAHFIAVSRECTARLTQRIACRAGDITTLPYGIGVPRTLSRDYQIDPLRLIYAGRITQLQKRVWDFVPLVEHLLRARVPFQFDVVGEGDHRAGLKDEMQDRFPAGCVRFHPRVPFREMPGLWSSHDVFLQVSDFEGTSVSMLEAMAHGTEHVFTAARSSIDGVVHNQQNGFVVPVGDMAAMAQVLARLATDRSLLATVGRAAHQTAQAYSMDQYADRFTQILDQVIETGKDVNVYQRYGMFGYAHPVFQLQQLITRQQEQIARLEQGAIQRLLDGSQRILPRKMRRLLRSRQA